MKTQAPRKFQRPAFVVHATWLLPLTVCATVLCGQATAHDENAIQREATTTIQKAVPDENTIKRDADAVTKATDPNAIKRAAAKALNQSAGMVDKAELQGKTLKQLVPDVGNLPVQRMPDPSLIAKRYEGIGQRKDDTALFIMVSFSMPDESIARLGAQAGKAGATLVLRGVIDDSLQKTAERAAQFIKQYPGLQFQIDPTLYKRYSVKQVPTFVLALDNEEVKACTKGCDSTEYFVSAAGDVSLDYALDYLSRQGGARFAPLAEKRLKKMRGAL